MFDNFENDVMMIVVIIMIMVMIVLLQIRKYSYISCYHLSGKDGDQW